MDRMYAGKPLQPMALQPPQMDLSGVLSGQQQLWVVQVPMQVSCRGGVHQTAWCKGSKQPPTLVLLHASVMRFCVHCRTTQQSLCTVQLSTAAHFS